MPKLFSYSLVKWIPVLHQRTGLNWACRATCPNSIIQRSPENSTALTWCSPEKGSHGLAPQLWSTTTVPSSHTCFPVPDITWNGIPAATRLSALMPPPSIVYSPGHCPHPLKEAVTWGAETARPLPHLRAALLTA